MIDVTATAPNERRIRLAASIAAGGLIGFGLILWIAANWDKLDKVAKFGLVGGALLAGALAAMAHTALRIPGTLVAFAAIGGIFSLFGQIYQSGADPWQLFALWAALGLPLALAARHDALWVPWTIVTFTGIPLWMFTGKAAFRIADLGTILIGLALAAGLTLGLAAIGRGQDRSTHWATRLAGLQSIGLVTGFGFDNVIGSSNTYQIYWLGVALLAATAIVIARKWPQELPLLVAAALAIDVLLITGVIRTLLFARGNTGPEVFFTIFIVAAGIMALTATALLKWHGRSSAVHPLADDAPADSFPARPRTWPITLLSGIGAILAAVPLLIFFAMLLGDTFKRGPAVYIIGTALTGLALVLFRKSGPLSFLQQFGFIALVAGLTTFSFGLLRDFPNDLGFTSGIILVIVSALAFVIRIDWIRSLLGAAAAVCLTSFIRTQLLGNTLEALFAEHPHGAMLVAALACLMLLAIARRGANEDVLIPFASGFAAAALVGLAHSAGPTFLLGRSHGMFESTAETGWTLSAIIAPALSIGATLAGTALLFRKIPALLSPLTLAITAILAVLSAVSTTLGFAVLVLASALVAGRTIIALFAAMTCLWIIGALYYWLGWPLDRKGFLLIALGAALALAVLLTRHRADQSMAPAPSGLRSSLAIGLIALSTVATAGILGLGIREKEAILSAGRTIYIALAPVDPRSLTQGDYMALRFVMPSDGPIANSSDHPVGIATIDARNIATISRLDIGKPILAPGEMAIKLRKDGLRWTVGTNAWFFAEGTGKRFEAAKFGEFRVGPSGDPILVGMADADLKAIR